MKKPALIGVLLFVFNYCFSQTIVFGTNEYIEYQIGTLPIVISVPHGGNLNPSTIPNRSCNNPESVTDLFTIEIAKQIKASLFAATGCYPHIIISHLKRAKLDCNRNIADGACANSQAQTAWTEFHNFITTAQNTANQSYSNKIFFVDLHGHGNPISRIELGYLLYDTELELSDNTLNTTQYLNYSSIKNLALNNSNNYTHAQLLRGANAFGTLLSNNGYPSVPSQQIPYPGTTTNYFNGGYITANHTCYASNVITNGLQMELNYTGIRDNQNNISLFGQKFALAVLAYLNTNFNVVWGNCAPLDVGAFHKLNISVYPNPQKSGNTIFINGLDFGNWHYNISSVLGQEIASGFVKNSNEIAINNLLPNGVYILTVKDILRGLVYSVKYIVQ